MTVALLRSRPRPDYQTLAPDLRQLLVAQRLFRRPDALRAAMAKPAAARARLRQFLGAEPPCRGQGAPGLVRIAPSRECAADVIYLHGGGLVFHDVACFRPVLARLAEATGRGVVAIEYPKAPECSASTIVETAGCLLLLALAGAARPVILAGDSVGALLALHAACGRADVRIERLVLINPVLNLREDRGFPSYDEFGSGYTLDADFMVWFRRLAREGLPAGFDPLELADDALACMPHLIIAAAQCDLLVDEAREFAQRLRRRGRAVSLHVHPGMPHDFLLYGPRSAAAAQATGVLIDTCFR